MKFKTGLIILIGLFMVSCNNNAHTSIWYGISGIGYEYDIPGNFEFCGTETIDDFSFGLYCYNDFREMGSCLSSESELKDYSECDYQASFHVDIEPNTTSTNADKRLNELLQSSFSNSDISLLTIEGVNGIAVVATIKPLENQDSSFQTYVTVLPHGTDYFAIIIGETAKSGQTAETWTAFELLAKTYAPNYGTPIPSTSP